MPKRGTNSRNGVAYDDLLVNTDAAETDIAYLAGIIDGEGHFQVSDKTNAFGIVVSVTDECLVDWLHHRFAGNVTKTIAKTVTYRNVHRWYLQRHADLGWLLPRLLPYLVIKKQQAEAMLVYVQHLRSYPEWDAPTSSVSKMERFIRREEVQNWRDRRENLRMAVRHARYPDEPVSVG
jgi:hypothetical protein